MGSWSGGDVGYKQTDGGTGKIKYGRNEREKAGRKRDKYARRVKL